MAEESAPFALVATYFTVEEAELNRAYLEASGLETHVDGAQIAGVLPLHVGATGGVKLLVRPGELARARELLGLDQERPSRSPATPPDENEGDSWMRRASFAAFLGLTTCPLLGTLYSLVLLLRYGALPRSKRGLLHRRLALAFNLLTIAVLCAWVLSGRHGPATP